MFDGIKDYIQNQINLVRLDTLEVVSRLVSKIGFSAIMALFFLLFLIILSLGGGFYFGNMDEVANGFFIIAGIYFGLIVIFLLFAKPIQQGLQNMTIKAATKPKKESKKKTVRDEKD